MAKVLEVTKGDDGKWYVDRTRFDTSDEAYEFIQKIKSHKGKEKPGFVSYFISIGITIWLVTSCFGPASKSTNSPAATSFIEALTKCQYALKAQSKDPDSAEVPYMEDFGSGNEFYFAWGSGSKPVRMKNGFGAIVSAGASCTVNKSSGKITSMSLDGKTVR